MSLQKLNDTTTPNHLVVNNSDNVPNFREAFEMNSPQEHSHVLGTSNGTLELPQGGLAPSDNVGTPNIPSPSSTSFSLNRHSPRADLPIRNFSEHDTLAMAEVNDTTNIAKLIREREDENFHLRKQLSDYSIKEAQIQNEKYVLEKRLAFMRLAFDQQQQDLIDASSKALSYRQDIIEENIRLTYALQDAQQDRSTFISSLLPLLSEYSMQPRSPDVYTIVTSLKLLIKHLQEKINSIESKLKESEYRLSSWHLDLTQANFTQSPSAGAVLAKPTGSGLDFVPQPPYIRLIPEVRGTNVWDINSEKKSDLGGTVAKGFDFDNTTEHSSSGSRTSALHFVRSQIPDSHVSHGIPNKQVTFSNHVSVGERADPDGVIGVRHNVRGASAHWASGNPAYIGAIDDTGSSYSPYLLPVPEEPSSSFSDAADDDPLPAIEGLQISGDAFPGQELQACGYSINGTTSCNFEWVRHLENGSVIYIDGAKQPTYLVTADDVEAYLAIEVQPLDDRKRKGELVKVFANEHRKITIDAEMQNQIERALHNGHTSYKVSISTGYLKIWEAATLVVKRDGYSIKISGSTGLGINEKFFPDTKLIIPYGSPEEFSVLGFGGIEHILRADSAPDFRCSRDTIVLTMRLFILRASEKKKGRKKGLFFNK